MNNQNSLPNFLKSIVIFSLIAILAACGTSKKNKGLDQSNVDINSIPNAVPTNEPYNQETLKPYQVNGKRYVPLQSAGAFIEEGRASWYGKQSQGQKTSLGETYDMFKMTAAHPTLPLPSYVRVTNVTNQNSVIVRVNDRGPFIGDRIIDLSYVAAKKLGITSTGANNVIVESVSESQSITGSRLSQLNQQPQAGLPVGAIPETNSAPDYQSGSTLQNQQQSQLPQLVPSTPVVPTDNQTENQNRQSNDQSQWLQIGAFSVAQNAQKLVARLKVSGYQNTQVAQKDGLYKVLVGPLDQQQLSLTQQSLKGNGYSAIRAQR